MKKWITWVGLICALIFLTVRMFFHHLTGVKNEKIWYLNELSFEFSGKVDNDDSPGRVLFRVTGGQLNSKRESTVNEQLQYNGMLDLLLYRSDGRMDLMIVDPHNYVTGDSLYLNSRLKVVRFYRHGKLVGEHDLMKSLRGRPF
jgi:hypothetical protein